MTVVGIAGLGLIGGSMAKALGSLEEYAVFGFDRDADVMKRALEEGAIQETLDEGGLGRCDILLLALYPSASVEYLEREAGGVKKGCLVVDCCGVKRAVWDALDRICEDNGLVYTGGHPMAGLERSGYGASTQELFKGAAMILTPGSNTSDEARGGLSEFFSQMGFSYINWTTPGIHDRVVAYTSQLAHVLSSAYVQSPAATQYRGFSAGSFHDMTRVAYLNADMWTELFLKNRDYLSEEVEGLAARLLEYSAALRAGDSEKLFKMLVKGSEIKKTLEREARQGGDEKWR